MTSDKKQNAGNFHRLHAIRRSGGKNAGTRALHAATILLLLLFTGASTYEEAYAQDKNEAKAAHAQYEKAVKKKSAAERLAALRAGVARYPQSAEMQYGLGREFYQQGKLDSATAAFERVVVLDAVLAQKTKLPEVLAAAYGSLATQRFARGKLILAVEAALAGLRHEAYASSCLGTAMVAYQQLGEYEQAVTMGLRLIKVQPSAQNYNNLGAAFESKGDWHSAKKYYTEALALAPQLAEAQNNLNRIKARLEHQTTAPAVNSKNAAAPVKKQSDTHNKTSSEKTAASKTSSKTASNTSTPKISKPAQTTIVTKPKTSPAASPAKKVSVGKTQERVTSAPPIAPAKDKVAPAIPSKDSTRAIAQEEPAAPQDHRNPSSSLWIGRAIGIVMFVLLVIWILLPQSKNKRRTNPATPVPSADAVNGSLQTNKKPKSKKKQPQPATAVAAVSLVEVDESLRMLARADELPREDEFPVFASSEPEREINVTKPSHGFLNEKFPEPARSEDISTQAEPEKSAPQLGLQTELLFAEMIAGALTSFEAPEEDRRAEVSDEVEKKGEAERAKNEMAYSSEENGATFSGSPALVEGPPHVNGKTESRTWEEVSPEPAGASIATPSPHASFAEENLAATLQEKPMEMTTMGFVAGVEEMMRAPIEEKFSETRQPDHKQAGATPSATTPASTPVAAAANVYVSADKAPVTEPHIGRYLIEKEIAKAATGRIYRARDPKLDRRVVLKTVQYGFAASTQEIATLKDRIYREARAIAKLSHPNIVIVYDVDDQPEFSYLVMEYLEGQDLKQVLETEHRMDCNRALHVVMQVCEAMEYAHRAGVFHRDVKPSNIMLLENDETKVTDFGIAKISNYLSLTQTGRVFGTPSYMAPEQIEGQATDGRADLFSLGIVLYELIAGKRPFMADSLAALAYKIVHKQHIPPSLENVEIPMEFDEILQRALAKNPQERYQSAEEFRAALAAVKMKLH